MMKVNQNIVLKSVGVVFQSDDNLIMRTGNKLEIISRLNGQCPCVNAWLFNLHVLQMQNHFIDQLENCILCQHMSLVRQWEFSYQRRILVASFTYICLFQAWFSMFFVATSEIVNITVKHCSCLIDCNASAILEILAR